MKNKKTGFTLAEILIALGILGVVSALTLPTFTSNVRYQALASKLSATISSVENGFSTMMSAEGASDITDTAFYRALPAQSGGTSYDTATGHLARYIKLAATANPSVTYRTLSDTAITLSPSVTYLTKSGAFLIYTERTTPDTISEATRISLGESVSRLIAKIDIDVNGNEKPNRYGRDIFRFALGDNGHLYPVGGRTLSQLTAGDTSLYWRTTNNDVAKCQDTGGGVKSVGCTARLIENNFKIDF